MTVKEPTEYKYFSVVLKVDVTQLTTTYCDGQDLLIKNCTEDAVSILESELNGWLDCSGVSVSFIKEVEEREIKLLQ